MVAKRVWTTEVSSAKSSTISELASAAAGPSPTAVISTEGVDVARSSAVISVVVPDRESAGDAVVLAGGGDLGRGDRVAGDPVPGRLAQRRVRHGHEP